MKFNIIHPISGENKSISEEEGEVLSDYLMDNWLVNNATAETVEEMKFLEDIHTELVLEDEPIDLW